LPFLVFDELHTYRGRQGADVALLIRRCRLAFGSHDIVCIGTSATIASEGTSENQKREVAKVAQTLFGVPFDTTQVIGETLERATIQVDLKDQKVIQSLREVIETDGQPPQPYEAFRLHALSSWIESAFGICAEEGTGRLVRQAPRRLQGEGSAAEELAEVSSANPSKCAAAPRAAFLFSPSAFINFSHGAIRSGRP